MTIAQKKLALAKSNSNRLGNDSYLRYLHEKKLISDISEQMEIGYKKIKKRKNKTRKKKTKKKKKR